jgi:hypothetical protein
MLKETLKRVGWIGTLNAWLKARAVRRAYDRTLADYRARPAPAMPPLPRLSVTGRPLRIFFVGTDEQQDRSGILQALERHGRVRIYTQADGRYGHNDFRAPSVRRQANAERLQSLVDTAALEGEAPDLLLAQTWATLIDPAVFDRIRKAHGTVVANLSLDDRHQFRGEHEDGYWGGTLGLVGHIDLALTAAPECVEWYRKEGCPALYFPEASDPEIFRPMPALPKVHDVCFVGGRYGIRERLVGALRGAGLRVAAHGDGWEGGRIATEDVPRLFAQSKIVLGVGTIGHCEDFYALKLRDFDGPMSGSAYLTHHNPDLESLYEIGREIATYRSIDDCVAQARALLANDTRREAIARAGRVRALRDHTWTHRFAGLFEALAATSGGKP